MRKPTVASIMTCEVFAVAPETDLRTAADLMIQRHISGAPVVGHDRRPIGVVTLADLADPGREHSERLGEATYYRLADYAEKVHWGEGVVTPIGIVADVMSPHVLAVTPDTSVTRAAEQLLAEDVHRLLVIDHGKLVGIVTSMDLLRHFVASSDTTRLPREPRELR